jgi:von Willebrand factor type A domain
LGILQLNIDVSSTVKWGNSRLRVALVLDNTGSVSSAGKMTALKTATHNLLTQLKNAASQNGDVYVSIIPFSKDVNVDPINYSQSWIRWSGLSDTWNENNGTCSKSWYNTKSSCTSNGGKWTRDNHNTWNGCVMDRDQDYDTTSTAPDTTNKSTLFPAEQYGSCPIPMMGLSYDWTALNNKIDAMTPTGNTNVTIGLQMAWQTLSPVAPFSAPAPAPDLDKVLILLTDGTNTQNRWTSSSTAIDARTQKACDNAKADNIRIYTIRVIDGNATLLKGCASKPDMYYEVQQAGQLNSVFGSIAQNLANLRIAK